MKLGARAGNDGAAIRVDALVELGRYDAARAELQAMVDRRPNLSGYARVSYLRELHGDLDGAVEAMRLAVDAGGPAAENGAYVSTLLGELERRRGRPRRPRGGRSSAHWRSCRTTRARGTRRGAGARRRAPPALRPALDAATPASNRSSSGSPSPST